MHVSICVVKYSTLQLKDEPNLCCGSLGLWHSTWTSGDMVPCLRSTKQRNPLAWGSNHNLLCTYPVCLLDLSKRPRSDPMCLSLNKREGALWLFIHLSRQLVFLTTPVKGRIMWVAKSLNWTGDVSVGIQEECSGQRHPFFTRGYTTDSLRRWGWQLCHRPPSQGPNNCQYPLGDLAPNNLQSIDIE